MMNLRETSHQPVFQLLSLVLVAICLYLPTLGFSFVWDDRSLILENWYIRDLGGIPGFFVSEFRLDPLISTNFYRPVVMSTYALDYFLWEENPMGFHLTNIILNTMVVLSVFLVARELLKGTVDYGLVPWVAALFFAVHPTHAESTAFIAGRTDLLAALFMLLAFWTYMRATSVPSERIRRLRYLGSLACFLLALFSKEVAIALLIILPLYEFYLRPSATTVIIGEQSSRRWMLLLPYLLVFAFYVVLRVFAVPPSLTFEHLSGSLFERFYPAGMALLQYIRMAFVPLGLKYYYFVELFKMTDPLFWISIGALIALTAGLFFVHRRAPLYVFCALWFLLTLFPALRIVPFAGADLADRYLYLPTVGSSLILALGISHLAGNKALVGIAATLAMLTFFVGVAITRIGPWKDDFSLFSRMAKDEPRSAVAHINLGHIYCEVGDWERANKEYYKAVKLDDGRNQINQAAIYINIGKYAYEKREYDEASKAYRLVLGENPNDIRAHYNLAMVYADLGMHAEAEQEYLTAIRLAPWYSEAYNNLGVLYKEMGRLDDAVREYREAIRYYPKNYEAHYSLAVLLEHMGDEAGSVKHYSIFIDGAPRKYTAQIEKARGRLLTLRGIDQK